MKQLTFCLTKGTPDGSGVKTEKTFAIADNGTFLTAAIVAEFLKFLGTLRADGDLEDPPKVEAPPGKPDLKLVE